jgi:DNA-binding Lrp family transcriptional regulator
MWCAVCCALRRAHARFTRVDAIDRTILAVLSEDGRRPFAELGAEVGLSASAAKRRVDRLRARGLIAGFTVSLGGEALAWRTQAFVELFCDGKTSPSGIRGAVVKHPEVMAAYTVTGDADALLMVRARDTAHLEEAVERIRTERFVLRTRTTLVLSRLVERPAPLE